MEELGKIADDIYSKENTTSHHALVANYEKYKDVLDKIDYNESQEKYDLFLQLLADYAIALSEIESYKKALMQIDKALDLFRNDKEFDPEKIKCIKFYELLLWNRGKSNYHLENYKEARSDFELLTKEYPENFTYKKWLSAVKNIKRHRIKNILWYCVIILLAIESFIVKKIIIQNTLLTACTLCLIAVIGLEINIYYQKKKDVV